MIYKFKSGETYHSVDAQTAGEELERIRVANNGRLRPEDVLKAAKAAKNPLHVVFTWDNKKAAHAFRLTEARQFIRAVVVTPDAGGKPQPAFWNILVTIEKSDGVPESDRYYQSSAVISTSPGEYTAALRVMLMELTSAQEGLASLRSLAPRQHRTKIDRATGFLGSAKDALE